MPRPASFTRPGFPARPATWALVAAAVLVQIVYPLIPDGTRTPVTVLSVLVFAAASLADAVRTHGPRGGGVLLRWPAAAGCWPRRSGVHTGFPFGSYAYTGTLGPQLLGVPVVVPLAWVMMAWPALVVGRTLGRHGRPPSRRSAAAALAALGRLPRPADGRRRPLAVGSTRPGLPLVPGVPLTNYAGWVWSRSRSSRCWTGTWSRSTRPSGPAAALYLWAYGSSVARAPGLLRPAGFGAGRRPADGPVRAAVRRPAVAVPAGGPAVVAAPLDPALP